MNGLRAAVQRDLHDAINVQIRFRRSSRAYGISLIGKTNVQGGAIDFGENRDRFNSQFMAGANHADCNLPAIGDEYLFEHGGHSQKRCLLVALACDGRQKKKPLANERLFTSSRRYCF